MKHETLYSIYIDESNDQFFIKEIKVSHHLVKKEKLFDQTISGKNFKNVLLNTSPQTKTHCKIHNKHNCIEYHILVCGVTKIQKFKQYPLLSDYTDVIIYKLKTSLTTLYKEQHLILSNISSININPKYLFKS